MLSVAIRDVIQNIIHHLLVLVPGILSPNSIPPLHLLFQRAEGIYKSERAFSTLSFSQKKKKKKKKLFPVMDHRRTWRDNHSKLRCAHFSPLKIQFWWLHFVSVWPISASEAHLTLAGNGLQSSHSDQTKVSALQVARCRLCQKMWLWLLPSFCHLVYGDLKSNLPLNWAFNPQL